MYVFEPDPNTAPGVCSFLGPVVAPNLTYPPAVTLHLASAALFLQPPLLSRPVLDAGLACRVCGVSPMWVSQPLLPVVIISHTRGLGMMTQQSSSSLVSPLSVSTIVTHAFPTIITACSC